MKLNRGKRSSIFTIIYLLALLGVVLLYVGLVYPKLSARIAALDNENDILTAQISLIAPYENDIFEISEQASAQKLEFETNNDLHDPILFSNIIYAAADKANVDIKSLSISEGMPKEIDGGYQARSFVASITMTTVDGKVSNNFINTIESNDGCAMYISSLSYSIQDVGEGSVSLVINLLTVPKE